MSVNINSQDSKHLNMDFKNLQKYDKEMTQEIKIISDSSICLHESYLLVNIYPQKKTLIRRMEEDVIPTKIFIDGPIINFNMMIKACKREGLVNLKSDGFLNPKIKNLLKIKVKNTNPFDVWIYENDPLGVLVLTPYLSDL